MNLADALVSLTFEDNGIIVEQGAEGDGMYFVENGSVSIFMEGSDGIQREVSVVTFSLHTKYTFL